MRSEQEIRAFTADREGVTIAAEEWTGPHAAPVVLIHGAGNSMVAWPDDFCRQLATQRPVVRIDVRDAGQSTSWPAGEPDYTLRDLVADVVAVVDATGRPEFHVVGVSMGGAIAQLLALEHPDRVRSITIISGTPGGPGHDAADLPRMTPELEAVFSAEGPVPDWSDREAVVDYLVEAERRFLGDRGFDLDQQSAIARATVDRAKDLAASSTNHFMIDPGPAWRDRLGTLRRPALIVHGEADPLFPVEHGRALQAEIPDSVLLVLEGHGHGFPPPSMWNVLLSEIERNIERGARASA